jgi:hypothetical protein
LRLAQTQSSPPQKKDNKQKLQLKANWTSRSRSSSRRQSSGKGWDQHCNQWQNASVGTCLNTTTAAAATVKVSMRNKSLNPKWLQGGTQVKWLKRKSLLSEGSSFESCLTITAYNICSIDIILVSQVPVQTLDSRPKP